MRKVERIMVECKYCKKEFGVLPNRLADGRGKFCSRKCHDLSLVGKVSWNKGRPFTAEERLNMSKAHKAHPTKYWSGKKRPEVSKWLLEGIKSKGTIPHFIHGRSGTPEYEKEKHRKYLVSNLGKIAYKNRCRLLKIKGSGSHTEQEWNALKMAYGFSCIKCGLKEPLSNSHLSYLTKDHIVPISQGGTNNISNIQPLCLPCNVSKYNKTIDYRYLTYQINLEGRGFYEAV